MGRGLDNFSGLGEKGGAPALSMATGNPCLPLSMIMHTMSLDKGLRAPLNEKLSVGVPSVNPMPPNAETISKTITP